MAADRQVCGLESDARVAKRRNHTRQRGIVRTVDLNQSWQEIRESLLTIAA